MNTVSNSFVVKDIDVGIQRIYVINLDRKPDRWRKISRELERIHCRSGESLSSITRRFSAIDARYIDKEVDVEVLQTHYSLADQLFVEPNPRIQIDARSRALRIEMTSQEVAIALSHIEIWKLIAASDTQYTLVLEDDAYFRRGFSRYFDAVWHDILRRHPKGTAFDMLYLSFQELGKSSVIRGKPAKLVHKPECGIWQASGYVLSKKGAEKLLKLLPAYGPIDLWLNLQFGKLDVFITQHPIIEQRIDVPSTNSYSVMPVLSQVGVHVLEKPLVARIHKFKGPIFAYGEPGTGLTSLAKALSMLGYTCCSDVVDVPHYVQNKILLRRRTGAFDNGIFNAYVNVGSFSHQALTELAKVYPDAKFILTMDDDPHLPGAVRDRVLFLPHEHRDKWSAICEHLEHEYPAFPYPICADIGQRDTSATNNRDGNTLPFKKLKFDLSPWVVSSKAWKGISLASMVQKNDSKAMIDRTWDSKSSVSENYWRLRDDTFPSNLALFMPENIDMSNSGMSIVLRKEKTPVRSFTSAAVVTRQKYLYGIFSAEIRPSNVPGLVTGIFLHRNGPHQEIDIEFLGKDTTKMLINVFYNPGIEGSKLEYGYRGTPALIELGFDAADEFHKYEIEWHPHAICWRIDGEIVHERILWDPTPIPDLPMEFNLNLWYSRSKELAGRLDISRIPAQTEIRCIHVLQS